MNHVELENDQMNDEDMLEEEEQELQDPDLLIKLDLLKKKKLQNLTNAEDFQVKIIDYGLACYLEHGDFAQTACGTLEVIAPEVLQLAR